MAIKQYTLDSLSKMKIFIWKSLCWCEPNAKRKKTTEKKIHWIAGDSIFHVFSFFDSDGMHTYITNRNNDLELSKHRFENLLPAIDKPHRAKMASCKIFQLVYCIRFPSSFLFLVSTKSMFNVQYAFGTILSIVHSFDLPIWGERWKMQMPNEVDERAFIFVEHIFFILYFTLFLLLLPFLFCQTLNLSLNIT